MTEEIWQRVKLAAGAPGATIMRSEFPTPDRIETDSRAEPEMRWVMGFIEGVRQIRGEMDIAPSRKLDMLLQNAAPIDIEYANRNAHYLTRLAGVAAPRSLPKGEAAPISAVALLGTLEISVPMAGLIEPTAELERLAKRQRKVEHDMNQLQGKPAKATVARRPPARGVAQRR